jgi:2-C-methyl-D-erythritol 4-phosphate cytidylyltransferase
VTVWAVLAAAGSGERLGTGRPKAFARLGDEVLLAESLKRLDQSDWVDAIVIVAPPGWEEPAILLAEELACNKVSASVPGGATRGDSVAAGLREVPDDALVVLVHDAARPILPVEVIERVVTGIGDGWDGAVPVLPIMDTVKRARGEQVTETLERQDLVAAQTPQGFAAPVLRQAFDGEVAGASDCAALVEARGGRVRTVAGDRRLLKVTTPEDLELVASWL